MNHSKFMMDLYSGKHPFPLLNLGLLLVPLLHGALGSGMTNTLSNSSPRLGETITLNCSSANGNATGVTWWKDKTSTNETVYVSYNCDVVAEEFKSRLTNIQCDREHYNFQLRNVMVSDSGEWQCEASGEPAKMLHLEVLVPINVTVKISKTTVKEHESVRFECITSGGNPEPVTRYQWLWKKNGSDVEKFLMDTPNEKVLEFKNIQYDRSGTYSCKALSDGGVGQALTVLNVLYSPRIDPKAKMKYEVAGHVGGEALFELFIIANPTPVATGYTWSKDGNVIQHSLQDYEITTEPTFSKLKIKSIKSSDYKNYTCSVKTSGFEPQHFNFALLKADPPPAPSGPREVNSTAVSATLEWISESPRGPEQRFYVQYMKIAENWENWENASEVPKEGITDPGVNEVVYHKVKDLKPNVSYVFRVGSKASPSGPFTSNFSNIVVIKTPEAPQTSVLGVSRVGNKVTVQLNVTGQSTAIKIKYCQTGTENCEYSVQEPKDNYATFFVEDDKTYNYYMIVEDSGDVVLNNRLKNVTYVDTISDDKTKHDIRDAGSQTGDVGLIVGGVALLILLVIVGTAIILHSKRSISKNNGEALELQNNVVNGLVEGRLKKAICATPTRSECDPNENGKCYPNSAVGSPQNLTHIYATPRKPDVVSDTQADVESIYQNGPISKKGSKRGGRLSLRGSRSSQPTNHAEECLYQNVTRNGQPRRCSDSGGVPGIVGVDGIVYAQLSIHGTSSPSTGHFDYPVRRTEVLSPYAVVNFRLKPPLLEDEDEVQYIT